MIRMSVLSLLAMLFTAQEAAGRTLVISQIEKDPLSAEAFLIVREAYQRIGHDIEGNLLPRERALIFSESGETEGELIRAAEIAKDYPNLILVPEPVLTYATVAFTMGLDFKVDGWESLRPYTTCVLRGNKMAEMATETMPRLFGNTIEQILNMLEAQRCQVAALGYQAIPMVDPALWPKVKVLEPPIHSFPMFHYLHKSHASLVEPLAGALREMHRDGTTTAIRERFRRSQTRASPP